MEAETIRLRQEALRYLLLQRTEYQAPLVSVLRHLRLGRAYDQGPLMFLEALRRKTISNLYAAEMAATMSAVRPYLPEGATRVLDIGCGLAGIDVFLHRHYEATRNVEFCLLDRDIVSDVIYYGFREEAAAYNSLDITRRFLTDNGIDEGKLRLIDVTRAPFPSDAEFDVVVSFQSWGFHYPVETYLDRVRNSLSPEGILVLDVRRDTGGEGVLRSAFGEVLELHQSRKFKTLLARGAAANSG